MIIAIGATGALNRANVDHLLERVPADDITVAIRDTNTAQRFATAAWPYDTATTPIRTPCQPRSTVPSPLGSDGFSTPATRELPSQQASLNQPWYQTPPSLNQPWYQHCSFFIATADDPEV